MRSMGAFYNDFNKIQELANTLHKLIKSGDDKQIESFLKEIKSRSDAIEIVNHFNANGNTALHDLILSNADARLISLLIEYQSDLDIPNQKNIKPSVLLITMPKEKLIAVFSHLKSEKQKVILNLYRTYLINNFDETTKSIYFKLAALHGLQALLIAHHEFNKKVPLKNYYESIESYKNTESNVTSCVKAMKPIPENIIQLIPRYRHRFYKVINKTLPSFKEQLLESHKQTLNELIIDIETFLTTINQRKPITLQSVLKTTCGSLTMFGMLGLTWYSANELAEYYPDLKKAYEENKPYEDHGQLAFLSFFTLTSLFFACIGGVFAIHEYYFIEDDSIEGKLKQNILKNIQKLKSNSYWENSKNDFEHINSLVPSLKSCTMISELTEKFEKIKGYLKNIQETLSSQPIFYNTSSFSRLTLFRLELELEKNSIVSDFLIRAYRA